MILNQNLKPADLQAKRNDLWELSGKKILSIERNINLGKGAPVVTVNGKYQPRGWTEWTQGFRFGSAILQFEATGEESFLKIGRENTFRNMSDHLTHIGVHDHGFNNISTYGNLLRLAVEGKFQANAEEKAFYELALKVSGAVQASRWSKTENGGFIYSFNGPHSLFVDTIRSCRILVLSHLLGQTLMEENDVLADLLRRAMLHMQATADYSVYYGEGRDIYDVEGRTAHESLFNPNDGKYRCPGTQQGYSGFSTWTRGQAWAILGFAEELELLDTLPDDQFNAHVSKAEMTATLLRAAKATCNFYIKNTPVDGIPYWDTGAPGLVHLGDYLGKPSDPFNDFEPVDSSAAAIAAQGLLRLGHYLTHKGDKNGETYWQAGLCTADALLSEPYISSDPDHEGLILHSVYHRPNGWDHIPEGYKQPANESSMWGDYHARELAVYLSRIIENKPYYHYFNCIEEMS